MNRAEAIAAWGTLRKPLADLRKKSLSLAEQEHEFFVICLNAGDDEHRRTPSLKESGVCLRAFTSFVDSYKVVKDLDGLEPLSILIKNGFATVNGFLPVICPLFPDERDAAMALARTKLTLMTNLINYWEDAHASVERAFQAKARTLELDSLVAEVEDDDVNRDRDHEIYRRADQSVHEFVARSTLWLTSEHRLSVDWRHSLTAYFTFPNLEQEWLSGMRPM